MHKTPLGAGLLYDVSVWCCFTTYCDVQMGIQHKQTRTLTTYRTGTGSSKHDTSKSAAAAKFEDTLLLDGGWIHLRPARKRQ